MIVLFKILWIIDALAALIVLFFFLVGIGDNTVGSNNIGLWLIILGGLAIVLLGSYWLKTHQYPGIGILLLCVLALPALLYLLYILIAMFGGVRWN